MAKKRDFIGVYKANKNNNGSVAQFKLAREHDCMFLELAKQVRPMTDPRPYDWENTKITVKLGESDIGKMLALFNGTVAPNPDPKKEDLMLYHQNEKGNKIIKFKMQDRGCYLKVSMKQGDRSEAIAIPLGWEDVELLKIALAMGYSKMLGW